MYKINNIEIQQKIICDNDYTIIIEKRRSLVFPKYHLVFVNNCSFLSYSTTVYSLDLAYTIRDIIEEHVFSMGW